MLRSRKLLIHLQLKRDLLYIAKQSWRRQKRENGNYQNLLPSKNLPKAKSAQKHQNNSTDPMTLLQPW